MLELLWTVPAAPLLAFLLLALFGGRLSRRAVALIGVGLPGLSALAALAIGGAFLSLPETARAVTRPLWQWVHTGGLRADAALYLDPLSLVFLFVVTCVGFLILLYAVAYMWDDEAFGRFFAYMNLFLAAMLVLVLADDLLLLFLGWEGVGLSSYLLIGFWYRDPANGRAARKAFIVTRIGDASMAVALFWIFTDLGTLEIQEAMVRAASEWGAGSAAALAVALLLLGGAVGKSGQLPLQTWLPDAMAGPTPVSALIHAATMVTAGVYLIARTHAVFVLSPPAMAAVAILGAATLLIAGFSALAQRDIKRVLAYSTISQVGYMFLGLGVGAWSAAVFHFMTHAFFKALLFMGAGAIIVGLHHRQDIFEMGGLRKGSPALFWTFVIGAASLAALPFVTAGFYSKDLILWRTWSSPLGGPGLFAAACLGAAVTSLYAFRLVFIVFFGERRHALAHPPGPVMIGPMLVLAVLSLLGGLVETPENLGHLTLFADLMRTALPPATERAGVHGDAGAIQAAAGGAALLGVLVAYGLYLRRSALPGRMRRSGAGARLHRLLASGFGFDALYDRILVRPFVSLSRLLKRDVVDYLYAGAAGASVFAHRALVRTVTGRVRGYVVGIAAGAVLAVAIVVLT